MKQMREFLRRFNTRTRLDENQIVKKENKYFLLNEGLKRLALKDFFYAGIFLGKVERGKFFPSFNLLRIISREESNKIIVDRKTEWLFICGRDIFKEGLMEVVGSKRKGDYTLVLNQDGECLGFGKIVCCLDNAEERVVVKNIVDIGDFLRREKEQIKSH